MPLWLSPAGSQAPSSSWGHSRPPCGPVASPAAMSPAATRTGHHVPGSRRGQSSAPDAPHGVKLPQDAPDSAPLPVGICVFPCKSGVCSSLRGVSHNRPADNTLCRRAVCGKADISTTTTLTQSLFWIAAGTGLSARARQVWMRGLLWRNVTACPPRLSGRPPSRLQAAPAHLDRRSPNRPFRATAVGRCRRNETHGEIEDTCEAPQPAAWKPRRVDSARAASSGPAARRANLPRAAARRLNAP